MKFRFAIDRGGTFTDVFAQLPDGKVCCSREELNLKGHLYVGFVAAAANGASDWLFALR
jgi:N-methylhydantoinase A/oxoprolinase/acetone carboxylase beta subunit